MIPFFTTQPWPCNKITNIQKHLLPWQITLVSPWIFTARKQILSHPETLCEGGSMRKADKIFHKLDAHESEVKHPAILLCWKLKKSRRHLPVEPVAEVFVDMVWMNSVTFSPPDKFIDLNLSSHHLHREPDIKHLPLFHLPFPLIWNQILQTPRYKCRPLWYQSQA